MCCAVHATLHPADSLAVSRIVRGPAEPGPGAKWGHDLVVWQNFNFLGFVVLISAVDNVDNCPLPRLPAVKPCSYVVTYSRFTREA